MGTQEVPHPPPPQALVRLPPPLLTQPAHAAARAAEAEVDRTVPALIVPTVSVVLRRQLLEVPLIPPAQPRMVLRLRLDLPRPRGLLLVLPAGLRLRLKAARTTSIMGTAAGITIRSLGT